MARRPLSVAASIPRGRRTRVPHVPEVELARIAGVTDRLLAGRAATSSGTTPRRRRAGTGLEFFELRPYIVGDSARHIDWRASARSRVPLVRTYHDEAFATAWLCLDRSGSMHTSDAVKWTRAIEVVAALAYLLLHAGNRVGLLTFGDDVALIAPPARGRSAYAHLVRRLGDLADQRPGGTSRLDRCARLVASDAGVTVVSDFLAPDHLRAGIAPLLHRGGDVAAVQILSPSETATPPVARALLRDSETGERRRVELSDATRARAATTLTGVWADLATYCRTRGVPLTRCDTTATWQDIVLRHVRTLQVRRA